MDQQPNLLFLFTDEQRQDTMRAYGNMQIETPNLDALAAQSTVFDRAYITQPVCTPSRASIMTGRYPHSTGCVANNIALDASVPTIVELFRDRRYRFAYMGKWHLGDEVFVQHGFDHWVSIEDNYRPHYGPDRDRGTLSSYHHWLVEKGFTPDHEGKDGVRVFSRRKAVSLPPRFTKPHFLAEEMERFIEAHGDEPFVACVNFLEPHMPFTGPYNDRYNPARLRLPASFYAEPDPNEPERCRLMREHYRVHGHGGQDLSGEEGWRRICANYWGLVTLVDEAVGRILAALHRAGLDERTIVVFTSDHGDMMASHRLLAKTVMYEEVVRVPLLVRVPWLPGRGRRVGAPVSQVDLVPTLLDLMGQPVPEELEGYSLRPVLEGSGNPVEDHVFIEWNGRDSDDNLTSPGARPPAAEVPVRTVISPDGWKLSLRRGDRCELYHLPDDPNEMENLYYGGRHDEVIARLRRRLAAWQARTGDKAPLAEEEA